MGTVIRAEISKSNKWWIDKHRYYELKHYCLQYNRWKKLINDVDGYSKQPELGLIFSNNTGDPTVRAAQAREYYRKHMGIVEKAAAETDPVIGPIIFQGVTDGVSYEILKSRIEIPCCKDTYYELYRKFYYILSQLRG